MWDIGRGEGCINITLPLQKWKIDPPCVLHEHRLLRFKVECEECASVSASGRRAGIEGWLSPDVNMVGCGVAVVYRELQEWGAFIEA
jgi:hypothetical protein